MTHMTKDKIVDWIFHGICISATVYCICFAYAYIYFFDHRQRSGDFSQGAKYGCLETVESYYKISDECLSNNTELYCTNKLFKEREAKNYCVSNYK